MFRIVSMNPVFWNVTIYQNNVFLMQVKNAGISKEMRFVPRFVSREYGRQ